jgi:hypothetical protein
VARVEALETAVAALQTVVADLAPTEAAIRLVPEETAPPCGRPFASWGAAMSDDVGVHLLQLRSGADEGITREGVDVYLLEVEVDNGRGESLTYQPEDFVLVDCDEREYAATSGGPEPAIAAGELAPGDQMQGWLTFEVPPGTQPAAFVYRIQGLNRSGAEVSCPLVDREAEPASLDEANGGAGCSARGASGGG